MELASYGCDATKSISAALLSLGVVFILIALHFYYKNLYSFWTKKGIQGPKPWPFVGNLADFVVGNRMLKERDWVQRYGKVYGIYQGLEPVLVVADPDVLRQVGIKDFEAFPNHDPGEFRNKYQKHFVVALQDEHWKRVRAMLSPTFTSIKIKRMFKLLEVCADDLVECFSEQLTDHNKSGIVNARDTFSLYTMDGIASCCYGLKLQRAGSSDLRSASSRNEFVAICVKLFEANWPRVIANLAVPKPILRLFGFEIQSTKLFDPLAKRVEKVIGSRRRSGRKHEDYLQLLLDAKFNDKLALNEMDRHENHHAGLTEQSLVQDQAQLISDVKSTTTTTTNNNNSSKMSNDSKIELSDHEILSNAVFLLMVGLETTATLLTNCVYALGFHQDCQAKLFEELSKIADDEQSGLAFAYEKLTSCVYLDAVISETLRCMSPVIQLDRVGNRDYKIEKYNLTIPKGTKVNLAFYAMMNDPDHWHEPDTFDPERFMPGQKENIYPGSYCPFGIGPRHCLGMRFSLTESKLALAKLVTQFKFEPAPGTTFPPEPKSSFFLNGIKDPSVRMIRRNLDGGKPMGNGF